jgi:vancomycin aglycone glucosyltransferase
MKVLLSSIGSRGDVQPILALALELRGLGHDARLCVAPNFKDWVESFGLTCIPIGPDLKQLTGGTMPRQPQKPSAEQRRSLAVHMVREQFAVVSEAARGCDLVVAAGALQIATRSVTEALKIPYVFAAYCPAVLPSPDHPPPPTRGTPHSQSLSANANLSLWADEEHSWNDLFRATLNEERAKAALGPVDGIQRHIFTNRPWLAADPAIAPAGSTTAMQIVQTGAWLLPDQSLLPDHLENFLANGEPPVYLGFGSMRASEQSSRVLVEAARALGRRSIISQGWANLTPIDAGADCISISDVNHASLFARVAVVVHHGGAGTTTTAARTGRPQVIAPHTYDQYYWASRVQTLGVGVSGPVRDELSVDAMIQALRESLRPQIAAHAQSLASRVATNGARIAANRLTREFG